MMQVASETGYRCNKFASNLRLKNTNTIGVVVPRLNSYFMATALAGIEKITSENGYGLIISQSQESWLKEISCASILFSSRVDGSLENHEISATDNIEVSQYFPPARTTFGNNATCPEKYLLWFHHLPWDFKVSSGRALWDELCLIYECGVKSAGWLREQWDLLKNDIDRERFEFVRLLLAKQERDSKIWRASCILYFQTFSQRPVPESVEKPGHDPDYYRNYRYMDIPGISGKQEYDTSWLQ